MSKLIAYRSEYGAVVQGETDEDQAEWEKAWQRSLEIVLHSPTGPEWGYPGSGPSQFALAALLWSGVEEWVCIQLYHLYTDGFMAKQPRTGPTNGFHLTKDQILDWVRDNRKYCDAPE